MSRHKAIGGLVLEAYDEMGQDSDEYEDHGLSEEDKQLQKQAMLEGRAALKAAGADDVTEEELADAVWHYYFDVGKSVTYLLQKRDKKIAKEKEKVEKEAALEKKRMESMKKDPFSMLANRASTSRASSPSPSTSRPPGSPLPSKLPPTPSTPASSAAKYSPTELLALALADKRPATIALCAVGHVDAGKSTLLGRLMVDLGSITARQHALNTAGAEQLGKSSFNYAWALDQGTSERERGITVDYAVARLDTGKRRIALLDTPGHADFVPNMIAGASQADAALLLIDARKGAFESGFNEKGQTKEHALLLRSLGIKDVIIVVNKLDTVNYNEGRYNEIKTVASTFLTSVGFTSSRVKCVPIAAMQGENLIGSTDKALSAWYTGPTLVSLLDNLPVPNRHIDGAFKMAIASVFQPSGPHSLGVGVSGRIASGVVQLGSRLVIQPGGESVTVRSLQGDESSGGSGTQPDDFASAVQMVTLYLSSPPTATLSVGSILCGTANSVSICNRFTVKVLLFDEMELPLIVGSSLELLVNGMNVAASVGKLLAVLDKATGEVVRANPRLVKRGTAARLEIALRGSSAGIALDSFENCKELGRVVLRRGGSSIGAGVIC